MDEVTTWWNLSMNLTALCVFRRSYDFDNLKNLCWNAVSFHPINRTFQKLISRHYTILRHSNCFNVLSFSILSRPPLHCFCVMTPINLWRNSLFRYTHQYCFTRHFDDSQLNGRVWLLLAYYYSELSVCSHYVVNSLLSILKDEYCMNELNNCKSSNIIQKLFISLAMHIFIKSSNPCRVVALPTFTHLQIKRYFCRNVAARDELNFLIVE